MKGDYSITISEDVVIEAIQQYLEREWQRRDFNAKGITHNRPNYGPDTYTIACGEVTDEPNTPDT